MAGSVTGVDNNDGMLAVAGRSEQAVTWQSAAAETLPFSNDSFDLVVSPFALMFFADPPLGLSEMRRVARLGGSVAVATWSAIEETPGYAAMIDLLRRLCGRDAATALSIPFTLGVG